MIERLRKVNDVKIYSVFDEEFKPYGRVVSGYDFDEVAGDDVGQRQVYDGRVGVATKINGNQFFVSNT